jgi:Peptidase family M28
MSTYIRFLPNFQSRALLFRTSSNSVAKAFRSVPHPHGNVLTENAFQRGIVRSDTDFTVYTKSGIPGLDLAFYKNRAVYHTKDDSIPTLSGKGALWNMLESALFAGRALTGDGNFDDDNKAVYFDCEQDIALGLSSTNNTQCFVKSWLSLLLGYFILLTSRYLLSGQSLS